MSTSTARRKPNPNGKSTGKSTGKPVGKSADDNVEVRRHGQPRVFDFAPQPHWDLGPALGSLDFERAVKIAPSLTPAIDTRM